MAQHGQSCFLFFYVGGFTNFFFQSTEQALVCIYCVGLTSHVGLFILVSVISFHTHVHCLHIRSFSTYMPKLCVCIYVYVYVYVSYQVVIQWLSSSIGPIPIPLFFISTHYSVHNVALFLIYALLFLSIMFICLYINATPDILPLYVSLSLIFHLATFSIHVPLESFIISFTLLSMLSPITTLRHPFKDLVLHPPTYHILLSLSLSLSLRHMHTNMHTHTHTY